MTTITTEFGDGGSNLADGHGTPDLATTLRDIADDLAAIRTAITTLTAKLDTDFTAQNLAVAGSQLDENYATTVDPAALATIKG
jgi:hypothetical protein